MQLIAARRFPLGIVVLIAVALAAFTVLLSAHDGHANARASPAGSADQAVVATSSSIHVDDVTTTAIADNTTAGAIGQLSRSNIAGDPNSLGGITDYSNISGNGARAGPAAGLSTVDYGDTSTAGTFVADTLTTQEALATSVATSDDPSLTGVLANYVLMLSLTAIAIVGVFAIYLGLRLYGKNGGVFSNIRLAGTGLQFVSRRQHDSSSGHLMSCVAGAACS